MPRIDECGFWDLPGEEKIRQLVKESRQLYKHANMVRRSPAFFVFPELTAAAQFASPLDALSTAAVMLSTSDDGSPTSPIDPVERSEFAAMLAKEGVKVDAMAQLAPHQSLKRRRGAQNEPSVTISVSHAPPGILSPEASPIDARKSAPSLASPRSKVFVLDVSRNYEDVKRAVDEHFFKSLSPRGSTASN